MILMRVTIFFYWERRKIIFEISLLPLLIQSPAALLQGEFLHLRTLGRSFILAFPILLCPVHLDFSLNHSRRMSTIIGNLFLIHIIPRLPSVNTEKKVNSFLNSWFLHKTGGKQEMSPNSIAPLTWCLASSSKSVTLPLRSLWQSSWHYIKIQQTSIVNFF